MKKSLNKSEIERFSRQIILKDIGSKGQEKIKKEKLLIFVSVGLVSLMLKFLLKANRRAHLRTPSHAFQSVCPSPPSKKKH